MIKGQSCGTCNWFGGSPNRGAGICCFETPNTAGQWNMTHQTHVGCSHFQVDDWHELAVVKKEKK